MARDKRDKAIIPQRAENASKRIDLLNTALGNQIHQVKLKNDRIRQLEYELQQNVAKEMTILEKDRTIAELKLRVRALAKSLRATASAVEGE